MWVSMRGVSLVTLGAGLVMSSGCGRGTGRVPVARPRLLNVKLCSTGLTTGVRTVDFTGSTVRACGVRLLSSGWSYLETRVPRSELEELAHLIRNSGLHDVQPQEGGWRSRRGTDSGSTLVIAWEDKEVALSVPWDVPSNLPGRAKRIYDDVNAVANCIRKLVDECAEASGSIPIPQWKTDPRVKCVHRELNRIWLKSRGEGG